MQMKHHKRFRFISVLTFVQWGFIRQRLLASCTARLKFLISMCSSARWHSSLPEEGTVHHEEKQTGYRVRGEASRVFYSRSSRSRATMLHVTRNLFYMEECYVMAANNWCLRAGPNSLMLHKSLSRATLSNLHTVCLTKQLYKHRLNKSRGCHYSFFL